MELMQIEYFLAVAEELHFGRAAARLHIAEQPLGYQIRKLERELGFKLFDRTTRSVSLTPAGTSFVIDSRRIIEQSKRAADTARLIAQGEAGVLRLGYESSTVTSVLPDFVKLFRTLHPKIHLSLVEYSKEGLARLEEGDADACLVTRYMRIPSRFEYMPLQDDIAVVALPSDRRLASKESVTIDDLQDAPFLGYADKSGQAANRFMARLAELAGSDTSISNEADTYMALLGLVSAGLGFTIVTSAMSFMFDDAVSYVPLKPAVSVDYGLAIRSGEERPIIETLRHTARIMAKATRQA